MDYKARLNELVSTETTKNQAEQERKTAYRQKQTEAFAPLVQPLCGIVEAASSVLKRKFVGESFGNFTIAGHGSQETTYDVEPNFSGGLLNPSPSNGFKVQTKTTYNNGMVYIEPTERRYTLPDANAVLKDLMTYIAKALASNRP